MRVIGGKWMEWLKFTLGIMAAGARSKHCWRKYNIAISNI